MKFDVNELEWTRVPADYTISDSKIEIITAPHTDLWQRTYYHFRNDNAPVLQMKTNEKFFSFVVKTEFESVHRFDQCGVVMYLDSENWLKGSIEYENDTFQHLGSVVTNRGYSDWATTEIDADIKSMWYRFSRREDDYCIECSEDGVVFKQMRVCHMWNGGDEIRFGIYACSPEDSSFKATFTNMEITECKWLAHDGQKPDEDCKKMEIIEYFSSENKEFWLSKIKESDWGAGQYLYNLLKEQKLKQLVGENTRLLLLVDGENLVSYCTFADVDDIQPTDLTPWIGWVYTFPAYRGNHYVGELLRYAETLAEKAGMKNIYISTNHEGLYEKYGYEFFQMMKDVEGEDSRVYVRRLLGINDAAAAEPCWSLCG